MSKSAVVSLVSKSISRSSRVWISESEAFRGTQGPCLLLSLLPLAMIWRQRRLQGDGVSKWQTPHSGHFLVKALSVKNNISNNQVLNFTAKASFSPGVPGKLDIVSFISTKRLLQTKSVKTNFRIVPSHTSILKEQKYILYTYNDFQLAPLQTQYNNLQSHFPK